VEDTQAGSEKITAPALVHRHLWTLVDACVFQTETKVYAQTYTDAEHTAQSRAFMLGVTLQGNLAVLALGFRS